MTWKFKEREELAPEIASLEVPKAITNVKNCIIIPLNTFVFDVHAKPMAISNACIITKWSPLNRMNKY